MPKDSLLTSGLAYSSPDRLEVRRITHVGIVSSHLLAARHIVELIKINPETMAFIVSEKGKVNLDLPPNARVVILIDLLGLPVPASEYLTALATQIPGCSFIALDRTRKEIDVALLLRLGFAGFVSHEEALHLLGPAVQAVAEGHVWVSPDVMRIYVNLTCQHTQRRGAAARTLTVRENQVLDLLRQRYSNRELANFLRISESTVKFHVSNVLMKLNVKGRRDLMDKELSLGSEGFSGKPGKKFMVARANAAKRFRGEILLAESQDDVPA